MPVGGRSVLVAWYGSFHKGGTIGDLLAMRSVVSRLAAEGHSVTHASSYDIQVPNSRRAALEHLRPADYDALIFVCGPIIRGHPHTQALFERFASIASLGVAVSLFPPDHGNFIDPFDRVLAREGRTPAYADVAIVAPRDEGVAARHDPRFTVGIVLRGPQVEYEPNRCLSERTSAIVREAARNVATGRLGRILDIENHLYHSGLSAAAIESQYAACDLVLTSRFHGAILAMRHGVPFVAVDQIEGGAKVRALVGATGWPHVYVADETDSAAVTRAAEDALTGALKSRLAKFTQNAIARAHATLDAAADFLLDLPASPPAERGWRQVLFY